MISYRLVCSREHQFEGWFRNSVVFDEQALAGELSCPMCGDTAIRKDIMAPALARSASLGDPAKPSSGKDSAPQAAAGRAGAPAADLSDSKGPSAGATPSVPKQEPAAPRPMAPAEVQKLAAFVAMARRVHSYVEQNFDNVGTKLPEEARRIHYGDTESRNIYGQASADDVEELREEGIDLHALPVLPKLDG